jgi:hypothetical protein
MDSITVAGLSITGSTVARPINGGMKTHATDSQAVLPASPKRKGPWRHRLLVAVLCCTLAVLTFWLLGFILSDVGDVPGPYLPEVEQRVMDASLIRKKEDLDRQLDLRRRQMAELRERQGLVRDSTDSSQRTIEQLSSMQRLSLERGIPFPESEVQALQEARQLFVANQKAYQESNGEIARVQEAQRTLETESKAMAAKLDTQRQEAFGEFQRLLKRHNIILAAWKLLILVPLAVGVAWLFFRRKGSLYTPMIYAAGAAVFLKLGLVMHEHFPSRLFKYVALLVALGIVVKLLVFVLRMMATPRLDWLLGQYREAYERFLCPVCSFPIRRGPLKYLFWTARSLRKLSLPATAAHGEDAPYTCPACSTSLYETCDACGKTRMSLLPACEQCGAQKRPLAAGRA